MSTEIDLDLQARIDTYLVNLRRCLGALPADEVNDILREIRGHILERAEASGELTNEKLVEILKALGKPEDIAPLYHADAMVARARTSFSPMQMLMTTARWGMMSVFGFVAFVIGLAGYGMGVGLIVSAILKPIFPENVGAFIGPHSFTIGLAYPAPPPQDELLGWWLIPVCLVAGPLFLIGTTHLLRWMLRFAPRRRPLAMAAA